MGMNRGWLNIFVIWKTRSMNLKRCFVVIYVSIECEMLRFCVDIAHAMNAQLIFSYVISVVEIKGGTEKSVRRSRLTTQIGGENRYLEQPTNWNDDDNLIYESIEVAKINQLKRQKTEKASYSEPKMTKVKRCSECKKSRLNSMQPITNCKYHSS